MKKVVVISSTNRPNSNTLKVSRIYEQILKAQGCDVKLLDFCLLPENMLFTELYGKRSETYAQMVEEYVSQNNHFVFVAPEYNGGFPGVLKVFLDSIHPKEWTNKRACLVGVSDGRAGNLRGMDHLAGVLQYLKMHVYHNKLPISLITKLFNADGTFNHEGQQKVCEVQIEGFLNF